ncbi:TauD/TfdA family dioxygenase [Streptomyces sp. NPDC051018]|uniref:TauD/TfdA family dioxygenase n=1 Tax=Streptomyces sp. NPDC051018 TaxID=3365639 RepID=UPI00379BF1F1
MPEVIEQHAVLFTAHRVDVHAPEAEHEIARRLCDHGLVTVEGLFTRRNVLTFAKRLMDLSPHPNSDPDGLTTIQHTRRHADRPGHAGLGQGELAAHTDRSQVPRPPRLILLVCEQKAEAGGHSLLVDGQEVLSELLARCPEAVETLSRPRSVYFGTGTGHPSQVFTLHAGGCASIRLRQDELARWSPFAEPYLPHLKAALLARQHRLDLAPGQAYLLDNHRWLHARTEFSGQRKFLRALGEPRFTMPTGFATAPGGTSSTEAA